MTSRLDLLRRALASLRLARAHIAAGRLGPAVEDLRSSQAATSFATGLGYGLDIAAGRYATGRAIDCTAGLRTALFHVEQRLVAALAVTALPCANVERSDSTESATRTRH